MLEDCQTYKLDIVITKNISRFGLDTVETLDALNQLKALGICVIFEQEELDTANTDSDLIISVIEAVAQAEMNLAAKILSAVLRTVLPQESRNCMTENAMDTEMIKPDIW